MSWFDDVANHILNHLEDYAKEFLNPHALNPAGKSIFVNSCPFCGHNNCFSLTKGVNAARCFSCEESGTPIQIVQKLHGEVEGLIMLGEWAGKPYNVAGHNPATAAAKEKHAKFQRICQKAVAFYHKRLRTYKKNTPSGEIVPLHYQAKTRKHGLEVLVKYQVGYSGDPGDFKELEKELLDEGYTQDEINEAKKLIFIPPGYFVYPYFDLKGNLVRFNCKLFVRYCKGKKKAGGGHHYDCDYFTDVLDEHMKGPHERMHNHEMNSDNFSRGDRDGVFFFNPKDINNKKKKYLVLVEGENDVESLDEAIAKLPKSYQDRYAVAGIGGGAPQGLFEEEFLRRFETVYEAFDNDDGGDKYREQFDREAPDVPLKRIEFPAEHNDIDDFLKHHEGADELFKVLLDDAKIVTTQNYKIWREYPKHHWWLKNRFYGFKYEIDRYDERGKKFSGTLLTFNGNVQLDKKIGDIDGIKLSGTEPNRLKVALSNKLTAVYHEIRMVNNEPKRTFEELLDVFHLTRAKSEVTKQIAWYIHHSPDKAHAAKNGALKSKIRVEQDIANIWREVNGYLNHEIDPFQTYPKIQLAQSLFPANGDGYMYFVKTLLDGDSVKRVPCLVSNTKEEIRLDLLKRKDTQSLLLINNKYELPTEIESNQVEVEDLSLQYYWVNKWQKGEIKDIDINPSTIIREIEAIIRATYYTTDDVVKVLALWIYATYFYTLFKNGFPYMVFNGAKGTGKSTLDDIVYLLAFNPTFSVSISGPALYRSVAIFGGTFILDEQENMVESSKVNESDLAAVIKAGYSDKGKVHRWNNELNFREGFSAFGPKVISNINGVEDVIADRCIEIKTYSAKEEFLKGLTDTNIFKDDRRKEIYSITGRAAISALTHFQEVARVFHDNTRVDTGNARLTQILRPLVTIARVVGGDYEEQLMKFYQSEVQSAKQDVALSTLEGKIKHILISIAEEHLGLAQTRWILNSTNAYDKDIMVDKNGMFEVDTIQFKVLAEQLANDPNDNYLKKQINDAVKNVMGKTYDLKQRRTYTKITMSDETLIKKVGSRIIQGYRYSFNVREFITEQQQNMRVAEKQEAEAELF